ncbi:hypothetical protein [Aureimonas leprariae]|uniref:Uncharacterized protein n=1 Tax=Plantimonas leprariae TaxID=2615207 RepID=A0A7V7PSI2_9HYPH|nr:hypothetical protein [Aureimonas leprariae]KAB0682013.1 hypothetical protein F6X38_04190 [Aureimonas leprariae]
MKRLKAGNFGGGQFGFMFSKPGEDVDTALYTRLVLTDGQQLKRVVASGRFSFTVDESHVEDTAGYETSIINVAATVYLDKAYAALPLLYVTYWLDIALEGQTVRIVPGMSKNRFRGDRYELEGLYVFVGHAESRGGGGHYHVLN